MSNNIDTRAPFFPNSRTAQDARKARSTRAAKFLERNSIEKAQELHAKTSEDAKVSIPESVKDYSRIRSTVEASPETDNTDKIASLKAQIESGTYNVDYDALADKMLASEY